MLRMIRSRFLVAGALALALASLSSAQGVAWVKGFDAAKAEAKKTNKLIMVDFWTTWCGFCKQMDATTMKSKDVIQASRSVVPVKLDAEREGATLARKHQVSGFPSFIFMDSAGAVFGQVNGVQNDLQFTKSIKEISGRFKDYQTGSARLKKNPKDGEALAILAYVNAARGQASLAEAQADKSIKVGFRGPKLASALVTVADFHRLNRRHAVAVGFYKKSLVPKGSPRDTAYAHYAISALSADVGQYAEAKKHAKLALQVKGAPQDILKAAKNLQAQLAKT